eukprot:9202227-Lingulodinium_polyedra.AAC.1
MGFKTVRSSPSMGGNHHLQILDAFGQSSTGGERLRRTCRNNSSLGEPQGLAMLPGRRLTA